MNDNIAGLTSAEVTKRIAAGQTNAVKERTSRSITDILRANVFTRFNALMSVLAVAVLVVGSPLDALFGLVMVINSAIGIIQELHAKRTLDKLAIMSAPMAHVMRDGQLKQLPIADVVLDDVLRLGAGDQVPADASLLVNEGLEIDESLLTGEAEPVLKKPGEQLLSGSIVMAGQGYARATAVGVNSYAHKIAEQVKKFGLVRSELMAGINKLLGYISWMIVVVAPILTWGQITHSGNTWQEAVVRSVAAIDGMVPNGLVLLTSLAFMLATVALARRNVLVQQLPAVEGLARVDVICLDKTGTLTEGKIVFNELIWLDDASKTIVPDVLAGFAAQPNSATLQALHDAFATGKTGELIVPFSSARKWSALQQDKKYWIMGAPEMVLTGHGKALAQATKVASTGQRVLVLLRATTKPTANALPGAMHPVALIVLSEKIRDDAKETLSYFAKQGVALKVISGDSPYTVGAIARAIGLEQARAVDARTLPTDQAELAAVLEKHHAFGRVTPDQKRAMVRALQSKGHVVAMTGDGVNDALALKDADIGIAMNSGAQATKSVAELILLDNKFATMPRVLAEGRRVIANIERVASLFIIKNVYSLFLALAVTVAALPYPFLPRHLTILSALTIGIPAFFFSLAPNNQRYIPGFLKRVLQFAVPLGLVMALLIFAGFFAVTATGGSPTLASTVTSTIVMVVGAWVLVCLARPLKSWKVLLIVVLCGVYAALLASRWASAFLEYQVHLPELWWALSLSAVGIVLTELLWRRDRKLRSPNTV
jgi:cation-transporting ATPase E